MAKAEKFRLLPEAALKSDISSGQLRRIYYIYGEESYLVGMYADKIAQAASGGEQMNYLSLRGIPDMNSLSDFAESFPFFSEYKCVKITDLNADEADSDTMKRLLALIESLPESTVMVISQTGLEINDVKPKANTQKLMSAAEKYGAVCRMNLLSLDAVAKMAAKKAQNSGCELSLQNGQYLAQLCGRSLTLVQKEVEKLITYRQSGEITKEDITALTPRMLSSSVYDLSGHILAGRTAEALALLNDLFLQREEPIIIMAALSGTFVDNYRAKLAQLAGKTPKQAAADYGYFGGRAYYFENTCRQVKYTDINYLKDCLEVMFRTNLLLNSSRTDSRILIEKAVAEISALK